MTKQIKYTTSSSEKTVNMQDVLGVSYSTGTGNFKLTEVVLLGGGAGGAGGSELLSDAAACQLAVCGGVS
jgi:hypothetical protein